MDESARSSPERRSQAHDQPLRVGVQATCLRLLVRSRRGAVPAASSKGGVPQSLRPSSSNELAEPAATMALEAMYWLFS